MALIRQLHIGHGHVAFEPDYRGKNFFMKIWSVSGGIKRWNAGVVYRVQTRFNSGGCEDGNSEAISIEDTKKVQLGKFFFRIRECFFNFRKVALRILVKLTGSRKESPNR